MINQITSVSSATDIIAELVLLDMAPWATSYRLTTENDLQLLLDRLNYRLVTPSEAIGYIVVGTQEVGSDLWSEGFKIYDIA